MGYGTQLSLAWPLVEPFGGDGKYQLVTFLWRGGAETQNVLVIGSLQGPRSDLENVLRRIPNTDVWYLTMRLQAGARFMYQLSPNDPLVSDGPREIEREATLRADPLNPNRTLCAPGSSKYACASAVELPGAVPQPWIVVKPGIAEGRIETFQVPSVIEKLQRSVTVYTPPGYQPVGPPNALLVLFDGPNYLDQEMRAPTTLNNLIASSKIPGTVAVFVSNIAGRRVQDLSPESNFATFIARELVPWVRARYNVTVNPDRAIIGGYSLGGLTAAYAGLRYSEVFGNVLSQSGSFWWAPDGTDATVEHNWMAKEFATRPRLPLRFYMDAGTFEAPRGPTVVRVLVSSRHLRDVLFAKGYDVRCQQFAGGHDLLNWRGTLADGLLFLLGNSSPEKTEPARE